MIDVTTTTATAPAAPPPAADGAGPERSRYAELRDCAVEAVRAGDLTTAQSCYAEALAVARELADPVLVDRALCNLAGVEIELREGDSALTDLRRVLMQNQDAMNCYLAAYALARVHDLDQKYKKAIFYARIAQDRARQLERPEKLAASHNQMGNLLLAESYFDDACAEYERALETPGLPELRRALILDNVGYCRIVNGAHRDGFRLLFESLRTLRRLGARPWQRYPHLALCFAYLEIGRYRRAARHGFAGFRLAEDSGDEQSVKNALYLLGETANQMGASDEAYACFETLQRRFFPGQDRLAESLMAVNVRSLVNLRA